MSLVAVYAHRLVVGGELVCVDAALRDARLVNVVVGLAVQALGEHRHLRIDTEYHYQTIKSDPKTSGSVTYLLSLKFCEVVHIFFYTVPIMF